MINFSLTLPSLNLKSYFKPNYYSNSGYELNKRPISGVWQFYTVSDGNKSLVKCSVCQSDAQMIPQDKDQGQ